MSVDEDCATQSGEDVETKRGRRAEARLLAACLTAAVALAAPAAAADKPYFQEFREKSCGAASPCVLDFPKIGKDKLARLTNVSCLVFTSSTLKLLQMDIVGSAFVIATVTLKPFVTSESGNFIVANDKIAAFVEAGQRVRIRAETEQDGGGAPSAPGDPLFDLSCHVAGSY